MSRPTGSTLNRRAQRRALGWCVGLVACGGTSAPSAAPLETCDPLELEHGAPVAQPRWESDPPSPTSPLPEPYRPRAVEPVIVEWPIVYDEDRMQLTVNYLRYHAMDKALTGDIEVDVVMVPRVVVLHWTAAKKASSSWWAFNPVRHSDTADPERALNLSTQFIVDRDGTIFRLYPEDRVGRHTIGLNHLAIGVENVGDGRRWPMTEAQVRANIALVRYLVAKYPITHVIGHHEYRGMEGHPYFREVDPEFRTEKCDPGPKFMARVRAGVADLGLQGAQAPIDGPQCRW